MSPFGNRPQKAFKHGVKAIWLRLWFC